MRAPGATSLAYQWGAAAMLMAIAVIVLALGFEHVGGYQPCPLCLQQRWAYYAGIPLLFVALVLLGADQARAASVIFFVVALGFLANAGLGVYHAGAEWKFWPGPSTCGTAAGSITTDASKLLENLSKTQVLRCDEAPLHIAGLSLAAWNAIASIVLFTASISAAFAPHQRSTAISLR